MKAFSLILLGAVIGQLVSFGFVHLKVKATVKQCHAFCDEKAPDEINKVLCKVSCDDIIGGGQCLKLPFKTIEE